MGMTCYIAHTYVVADEGSAYYELGFDNEMRPNIVVTESFMDDFTDPAARKKVINDAFDANYTWREGDQYSYYSSDPWEDEKPYTMADEIDNSLWVEQRKFDKFFKAVEKMDNIKYVLLATDATKPSDNYGEFWYDALVCDFKKRSLVKIEWRGARATYLETHYGENMFNEDRAGEIIALLEQNAIDQIDSGDFELNGVLQGKVTEFPVLNSSKIPNNNQCIHILPSQVKQTDNDEEEPERESIEQKTKEVAINTSDKEPIKRITMKEAFSHAATGISGSNTHIVGLKSDGTVIASKIYESDFAELSWDKIDVGDWEDIIMISTARSHTVGLKSDGTVVSTSIADDDWDYGQTDVSDWKDIVAVSAASEHTVGLKSDGSVVSTLINDEDSDYGQTAVFDWSDIVMISANDYHTVGLKSDGTVVSTSITDDDCDYGQTDVSDWSDIVMISANDYHTVGLKSDGTVVAVGSKEYWQTEVDDWENIVAVFAGKDHTVGLKSDGTVIGIGGNPVYADTRPELIEWNSIITVAAGNGYSLGLRLDGSIVFAKGDSIVDENLINYEEWQNIINNNMAERV